MPAPRSRELASRLQRGQTTQLPWQSDAEGVPINLGTRSLSGPTSGGTSGRLADKRKPSRPDPSDAKAERSPATATPASGDVSSEGRWWGHLKLSRAISPLDVIPHADNGQSATPGSAQNSRPSLRQTGHGHPGQASPAHRQVPVPSPLRVEPT